MPYEEKQLPHHIVLEGRESLSVSGVEEVESFDENHRHAHGQRHTGGAGGGAAH